MLEGIIFLQDLPDQKGITVWSGFIYGAEFGGAVLLGGLAGLVERHIVKWSSAHSVRFDLTREPPSLDLLLRIAAVGALPEPSGESAAPLDIWRPPVTTFVTSQPDAFGVFYGNANFLQLTFR